MTSLLEILVGCPVAFVDPGERVNGPRYVEAVRGGRRLTEGLFYAGPFRDNLRIPANGRELSGGIPVGWISRGTQAPPPPEAPR